MESFGGDPFEIGLAYGRRFSGRVKRNIQRFLRDEQTVRWMASRDAQSWVRGQEHLIARQWPWLLGEVDGVAQGAEVQYDDILLLNLRVWQFNYYGAIPYSCSNLAITLADGTIALAGTLDDMIESYCGAVTVRPRLGHSFVAFPVAGTSWACRGINDAGLAVGTSSQVLPHLVPRPGAIIQDIAIRIILQTLETTDEVREFCRSHPFTVNLLCADTRGGLFCAHQTAAGLFELESEGFCAITNHIIDDRTMTALLDLGAAGIPEIPASRLRRDRLLDFAAGKHRRCGGRDVMRFVSAAEPGSESSINNDETVCITYCNPMKAKDEIWIIDKTMGSGEDRFEVWKV